MSISAMKQALEALDCIYSPLHVREINKVGEAMSALRQAIAEAEKQEPVAECTYPQCQATNGCVGTCSKTSPTAWAEITKEYVAVSDEPFENATPLYTKRKWVGLTDEERDQLLIEWESKDDWACFDDTIKAIENSLKEKNSG